MLVVWHGASEVMGGLLVTLAPNVVNGLTRYSTYALYQIRDLTGMTDQVTPRKARMWLGHVHLPSRRARVLVFEAVHQR